MRYTAAITALLLSTAPALAEMVMLGDLHIERAMLRATPPNAPVAVGYVTIVNTGDADDTLVAAAIAGDVARTVQLHGMAMENGVMRMEAAGGGIALPAGAAVTLSPGGRHLMVMGLQRPLTAGDSHAVTLTFAQAGTVTLEMPVLTLGEIRTATEEAEAINHSADHSADHSAGHSDHGENQQGGAPGTLGN